MDNNPEDETSYTTKYQEAFMKYVENEYCAKHRRLPVTKFDNTLNNNLSSFERLLDLVNLLMMDKICPAMTMNT
jgi:hypothetical protein